MLSAAPRYACAAARPLLSFTVSLIVLLALAGATRAQDIAAGRVVFGKCGPCHAVGVDAQNRVGPPLNGLFGRKAASLPGFAFSDALRNSGIVWDDRSFQQYIANPRERVPGGKMTFAGIGAPQQIRDLAAYLKQFDAEGKLAAALPPPPAEPVDVPGTLCRQALGTAEADKACAGVGGAYLQAVGILLAALPFEGAGVYDKAGLTTTDGDTEGSRGTRFALSAEDPCIIEEFALARGKDAWTSVLSRIHDLHKARNLRPIAKIDDLATRASTTIDDPALVAVLIEGAGVTCTAPGADGRGQAAAAVSCMDYLLLNAFGPENKAALFKALPIVRKACTLPG